MTIDPTWLIAAPIVALVIALLFDSGAMTAAQFRAHQRNRVYNRRAFRRAQELDRCK